MPTPIEIFLNPISLIVIGMYAVLFSWESLFPRNKNLPTVKYATLRGLLSFALFLCLGTYLPLLTDAYLASYQLFNLSQLHPAIQVLSGLLVYQAMLYAWHRTMHRSNALWRIFHQMHHSAEKLDIPSAFYFSPMDMLGFTLLGSIALALMVGVEPAAATIILVSLNFLSMFQHANIRTPQWLGYLIQRPEQHAIHHSRGVHGYNFADFPLFDLVFGTFKNPKDYQGQYGFYDGASMQVLEMLSFKDIAKEERVDIG